MKRPAPPDDVNTDVDAYLDRHPLTAKCPYEDVTHRSAGGHNVELVQRFRDSDDAPQWAVECLTCGATSPPEARYQDAIHVFNDGVCSIPEWTLGRSVNGFTLQPGQEWHRQDWTEDMLPDGWRPLLKGEMCKAGDSYYVRESHTWRSQTSDYKNVGAHSQWSLHRTRRPLPIAIPAGFTLWSGGECPVPEGARMEYILRDNNKISCDATARELRWYHTGGSGDIIAYRIKPAPVMVPLGPEDVPPGSVFRQCGSDNFCADLPGEWVSVVNVDVKFGVIISAISANEHPFLVIVPWDKLTSCEINRSLPLTERWDMNAWEKCEKPEVQP